MMASLPYFHKNDTGTWVLVVEDEGVPQDISTASAVSALIQKPDGTFTTWTAALGGGTGEVNVTLPALTSGDWKIQLKLTFPTKVRHTQALGFHVYPVLA